MRFTLVNQTIRERAVNAVMSVPDGHIVAVSPPTRTNSQNRLYWKWVNAIRLHILDSTGKAFSSDEVHEFFKSKFLPSREVEIGGEVRNCKGSTAALNTKDMAEYMDRIDNFCVESLQLYLPYPGEE